MARTLRSQAGLTLIELTIAVVIGALVLAALHSVVSLGLRAQAEGGQANELLYQGQFALQRMVDKARSVAPKTLTAPAANSTGDWFAPAGCVGAACVMFCRNTSSQKLIETITLDAGCIGTKAIVCPVGTSSCSVTAFSATLPPPVSALLPSGAGPVNRPTGVLSLTLTHSAASQAVTLTTSVRLGGGTK
jgi:prepilin-type N-terminal cleavage/methylation domain-containing protein